MVTGNVRLETYLFNRPNLELVSRKYRARVGCYNLTQIQLNKFATSFTTTSIILRFLLFRKCTPITLVATNSSNTKHPERLIIKLQLTNVEISFAAKNHYLKITNKLTPITHLLGFLCIAL